MHLAPDITRYVLNWGDSGLRTRLLPGVSHLMEASEITQQSHPGEARLGRGVHTGGAAGRRASPAAGVQVTAPTELRLGKPLT